MADNNAARFWHAGNNLINFTFDKLLNAFSHRTGKFVGYQIPGSGVIMMMLEGIVPVEIRNWFNVIKDAVLDKSDDCEVEYLCTLSDIS